ncbi:putative toxin-antitoxin system toxin component, PIN family [Rhizobium sp. TH2]|uniref:putative toxin-antitoxin system toxin component, PIN family n=1 Tax=Rhizobium sp. TH2 TaxID=2775403 RepID=UPI002157BC0B|nr:putative toxin-antitoxin system toxin component, PIN family [Rhizobium sp. TH2]
MIDTNIFVSAVMNAEGTSRAVLRMCLDGTIQPLMSNALAAEYEDLCSRTALFDRALISADIREELLDAFMASCLWVRIYYLWRPNSKDEADNHVIELAVGGGAQVIVTANKRDFTSTELLFPKLGVRTAAEFLKERRTS